MPIISSSRPIELLPVHRSLAYYHIQRKMGYNFEMGPNGLAMVFNKDNNLCRRVLWLAVVVFGLFYSAQNVYKNSLRYSYETRLI